ncbi:ATP-binding protein [uncultured Candidatus Kuenenia sp.]|uniref:sensor histidine kinase n=1 Tax=uncultured Candidatus Kuenenia sp. TaxID=1048336 RepID=UPI000308A0A8|nr:ATP-binding protein [uncultured Candidatus Kuenenia sp.]
MRDTGIGIEDDEKDKIFSAFYRSNSTKDKDSNGAGIGIALTRRLVELHGGMVGVESNVDNGSIFWLTFPENECIKERTASGTQRFMVRQEAYIYQLVQIQPAN